MDLSLFEIFFRHYSAEVGLTRQDAERISIILATINSIPYMKVKLTFLCKLKKYEFIDSIKLI